MCFWRKYAANRVNRKGSHRYSYVLLTLVGRSTSLHIIVRVEFLPCQVCRFVSTLAGIAHDTGGWELGGGGTIKTIRESRTSTSTFTQLLS